MSIPRDLEAEYNAFKPRCPGCNARLDLNSDRYCKACEHLLDNGIHPRSLPKADRRRLLKNASAHKRRSR